MESDIVSFVRTTDSDLTASVLKALDLMDFRVNPKADNVFIKPNLCYYWDALTGYTTDPRLVGSLIDVLRENYGLDNASIRIAEADATAMRTSHAFKMLRFDKLANEKNVVLFNLADDKTKTMKAKVSDREISFVVPESLLNADLFINVPKMKSASRTVLTCALKNVFGCIAAPRKIEYHPILHEAIVGINKILKPHVTLVDGLIALSKSPVRMNLVIAGHSPFSVDLMVSKIMGYSPFWIRYLRLAKKEGLGDPKKIRLEGENWKELKRMYPSVNPLLLKWQNSLQLSLLKLYSKISGDVVPPFLEA